MRQVRRPTIVDVAKAAGVSVGSASNVLNETKAVSAHLRDKVLAAAAELDYSANALAQSLRRRRSGTIGFCTTTVATVYLRSLADALDEVATAHGFELLQVLSHEDPNQEATRVRNLIDRQVDGLILLPTLRPERALDILVATQQPSVIVDRPVDDPRFSGVAFDNRAVMGAVIEHLVVRGHRRILFVAQNLQVITTRHRIAGLRAAAAAAGLAAGDTLVVQKDESDGAYASTLAAALDGPRPPTAIITGNSRVAITTIKVLRALGVEWPRDVSLMTFDDPEWATLLPVPLSTVASPIQEMAAIAWTCLAAQMKAFDAERRVAWIGSDVVLRDSITAIPAEETP